MRLGLRGLHTPVCPIGVREARRKLQMARLTLPEARGTHTIQAQARGPEHSVYRKQDSGGGKERARADREHALPLGLLQQALLESGQRILPWVCIKDVLTPKF